MSVFYERFTLDEWLDYLENRHTQEIHLGLSRIKEVAHKLDLLNPKAIIITVGGTNGKGSTVAALETFYIEAGFSVGSYTSPHLLKFNERICIDKQAIADATLCHAFCLIEAARGDIFLTYFEMVTLAALWHFKMNMTEVILLEVGMGGRLDATNIIHPHLAIITTIDIDHQAYLGDTREEIAYEKAGIIRPKGLFIYGDENPPETLVNEVNRLLATAYYFKRDYDYTVRADGSVDCHFETRSLHFSAPKINLKAASCALVATYVLESLLPITDNTRIGALQHDLILGRQQLIKGDISLLLDVAHNPQAVRELAKFVSELDIKGKIHVVFSALKDKDLPGLIAPFATLAHAWYPALLPGKRAADGKFVVDSFKKTINVTPNCDLDPILAYNRAVLAARPGDLIVVYGSFLTVGPILAMVNTQETGR